MMYMVIGLIVFSIVVCCVLLCDAETAPDWYENEQRCNRWYK